MIVRGAPAIGVSAAMGVAIGIDRSTARTIADLNAEVEVICETLASTRPTAVNLFWGIGKVRDLYNQLAGNHADIRRDQGAVRRAGAADVRRGYCGLQADGGVRGRAAAARRELC